MDYSLLVTLRLMLAICAGCVVQLSTAFACFKPAERVFEDLLNADAIFEAKVIEYHGVGCPREPLLAECHALIGLETVETIHGERQEFWTMYWGNSIYGIPETWEGEKTRIFAGQWVTSGELPVRSGSATTVASLHPDLLQLVQAPCSDPFILPATQEMKNRITQLFSENSVETKENDQSH